MIYPAPSPHEALTQGDILNDCPLVYWEFAALDVESEPIPVTARARVVVLTQACDLVQSEATRVLVAIVHQAQHLLDRGLLKSRVIRDQIRSLRVYGWHVETSRVPRSASSSFSRLTLECEDLAKAIQQGFKTLPVDALLIVGTGVRIELGLQECLTHRVSRD